MGKIGLILLSFFIVTILISCTSKEAETMNSFSTPVDYATADLRAEEILNKMSIDDKIKLLGGYSRFFIHGFDSLNIPYIFMADATQGVRLTKLDDSTIVKPLEKTTAFPSPILLASTWNPDLAKRYAQSVGEECRAAGVNFLLGPGLNMYRISQCGRNFEYFGEDPFLISRMIENYVVGVQSTGTSATLKHFAANNTDFYRRRSNSIVDERALHEIYLPGFKAGIDAGVTAVMTSYNKLNGEWCGQSEYAINQLLRKELGFKWLVMTDWTSVYDGEKVIKSGQDLEMPELKALANTKELLDSGKVSEEQINRMAKSILRTCIAMGFYDRPQQDLNYLDKFPEHEKAALETAREGIVLLKNESGILPVKKESGKKIVAVGKYIHELAHGGGAATVKGYNNVTLAEALKTEFSDAVDFADSADVEKISSADIVLLSIGTFDNEGWDRAFDLPTDEEVYINTVLDLNKNTIVVVNSGAGINMSRWVEKCAGLIYAWYGGQTGNIALTEIIAGKVNPSGKLPITIEKQFQDSPGFGYIPEGEELYTGWRPDKFTHKEYDVHYDEGIFVGYRWYEHKNIQPLFPFGFGLSYTSFEYSDINTTPSDFGDIGKVVVDFKIKNTGNTDGAEIAQVYVQDVQCTYPRPVKELKGFKKVLLKAGEEKEISIELNKDSFSFWNPDTKEWTSETGKFKIMVGSSSGNIILEKTLTLQ